jgi:dolichol kinase
VAPSHLTLSPPALPLQREFVRKSLHLAAAGFPIAYSAGVARGVLMWVLAGAGTIALLTEALRRTNTRFASAFAQTAGPLMRNGERQSITGATWLALSCLFAVAVLSRQAAIAALWCATAGDPAATITGRLWTIRRKTRDPQIGSKTVAGSLACGSVSFAGTWLLAGYAPALAIVIAAATTVAERIPSRIDDNIRVTVAAGAIAQLLT